MYHRVAEPPFDPWGLAVSPVRFEEQMATLARFRSPMSMHDFVDRFRRRRLPADAVGVTFDDGYLDNLTNAKPRLEAAGVPATVFITTGRIGRKDEFWWDELARIVLGARTPLDLELPTEGEPIRLRFDGASEPSAREDWRAWEPTANAREEAYASAWRALQACAPSHRETCMARLRELPSAPSECDGRPMDSTELQRLFSPSISAGAHGVSHQPLPSLSAADGRSEIVESGEVCRGVTGQAVEGFAFPHGAADNATRRAVAEAGYNWACSTEARSVDPARDDPYDLPRLQVGEWTGAGLTAAIRGLAA